MKPGPEKRQYPRRTSYIIAEYTILEGTFRDIIKNIGAGGLFIKTNRRIAIGQPVLLKFPLFNFDQTIEVYGRIARRDPDGFAVTFTQAIEGLVCKEGHFPEIIHEGNRLTKR